MNKSKLISSLEECLKLLIMLTFLISGTLYSQNTGDYRSATTNGIWTSLSSWEYYNGIAWITPSSAIGYPGQNTTGNVTIQTGQTVNVNSQLNTGQIASITVNGKLGLNGNNNSSVSFYFNTSTIAVNSSGSIEFNDKVELKLPTGATLKVGNNGLSGDCSHNQNLYIGTIVYAYCQGPGNNALTFNDLMASGGSFTSSPTSNSPVCQNGTINLYGGYSGGTTSINSNSVNYNWTITAPDGTTLNSSNKNYSLSNALSGTYSAKLQASTVYNSMNLSDSKTIYITVTPLPQVTSSTPGNRCDSGTVILGATANSGTINWYGLSAGGSSMGTGSSFTTPSISSTTTYFAEAVANGCTSSSRTAVTATVNSSPAQPSGITSSINAPCTTSTGTIYSVTNVAGVTYNWTYSGNGASIASGNNTNSITVNYNNATNGIWTVTPSNLCGNGPVSTFSVSLTPAVGTPSAIIISSGIEPTCQLTNGTTTTAYSTSASNSTGFNWAIDNPQAGIINPSTGLMTWKDGFYGNVNIQVSAIGCNDSSAQISRMVTVSPNVGTPAPISISSGTEPTCQLINDTTTTAYSTLASNSNGFNWSIDNPLAGTINTSTGLMTWNNNFSGNVNIQVTAVGCNGPSATVTRNVTVNSLPNTSSIVGASKVCQNSTSMDFSVENTNGSTYNWTVPNDAVIVSGNSTNSIKVNFGTSGGNISVNETNDKGCIGNVNSLSVETFLPKKPILNLSSQPDCTINTGIISISNFDNSLSYEIFPSSNTNISGNTITVPAGTFTAKAVFNSCSSSSSNAVTVNNPPSVNQPATTVSQPNCTIATGSIIVSYPVEAGNTYSINGTDYSNSTGTFTSLNPGTYTVTVKNAQGCTSDPVQVSILSATSKNWAGTTNNDWFNPSNWIPEGVPTKNNSVTINNAVHSPLISNNNAAFACSISIASNAKLEIESLSSLTVTNEIIVDNGGIFLLQDSAGLVQKDNVNNIGNITVIRKTAPMILFDYTYWSSPTFGNQTLRNFSPNSNPKYFLAYNNGWIYLNPNSLTFEKGLGYAIIAPKDLSSQIASPQTFQFVGTPNNGTISVPVTLGSSSTSTKLIGNPYPSAISADAFILANCQSVGSLNKSISGTLYFWTHNNGSIDGSFQNSDYASYNLTGGIVNSKGVSSGHANKKAPEFYIASGQGFLVETKANGNVTFTNEMRVGVNENANNSNFYRSSTAASTSKKLEKHRIWLDITDNNSNFNQALFGYVENASNGIDPIFDGSYNTSNTFGIYSLIDNEPYSIQAKALPFNETDILPLGFKTDSNGIATISLNSTDGLFENGQYIYLEDKLTNVIHALNEGPYSFETQSGTYNDRFFIKFKNDNNRQARQASTLNEVSVLSKNQEMIVKCPAQPIKTIMVYDHLGRLVYEASNIDNFETTVSNLVANSVYIVKTVLKNGESLSSKVIF